MQNNTSKHSPFFYQDKLNQYINSIDYWDLFSHIFQLNKWIQVIVISMVDMFWGLIYEV